MLIGLIFACGIRRPPLFGFYNMLNLFTVFFQLSSQTIKDDTFYYGHPLRNHRWQSSSASGPTRRALVSPPRIKCYPQAAAIGFRLPRPGHWFLRREEHNSGALTSFLSDKATVIEFLTGGQLQAMLRGGCTLGTSSSSRPSSALGRSPYTSSRPS